MPGDTKEVNLTYRETKLCEAEDKLRNNRRVGDSDSPATCFHHESSGRVTKGRNNCINIGVRGRCKSRTSRLYCTAMPTDVYSDM